MFLDVHTLLTKKNDYRVYALQKQLKKVSYLVAINLKNIS